MEDSIKRSDVWNITAILHSEFITIEQEQILERIDEMVDGLPSADRPQEKWIRTGRTNIYGGIEVQCSNCGDRVMVQHLEDEWYCRHCGADMGMKGADDE